MSNGFEHSCRLLGSRDSRCMSCCIQMYVLSPAFAMLYVPCSMVQFVCSMLFVSCSMLTFLCAMFRIPCFLVYFGPYSKIFPYSGYKYLAIPMLFMNQGAMFVVSCLLADSPIAKNISICNLRRKSSLSFSYVEVTY